MTNQLVARKSGHKLKPQFARDSYKLQHDMQYPMDTEYVYSNFTPRSAKHFKVPPVCGFNGKIGWVGLQGTMMEYRALWAEQFFFRPWTEVEAEYIKRTTPFLGSAPDTTRLKALHDLGYLPLHVKQIPEGSYLNLNVPAFTVVNTNPDKHLFGWLTNATETYLSNESWKLSTTATIAIAFRKMLDHYAAETGTPAEFVDWQGHCFSDRGVGGYHDAAKNLAGHSFAFLGSDSVSSADWLTWAYFADDNLIAGSVPASEHAVTSLNIAVIVKELQKQIKYKDWTKEQLLGEAEYIFLKKYITEIYPTGVASYVSDTYDFFRTISEIALRLKDEIMARQPDAQGLNKVVFRPDSGNPVHILTGYTVCPNDHDISTLDQAAYDIELHGGGNFEAFFWRGDYYEIIHGHDDGYGDYLPAKAGRKLSEAEVKGAVETLWDIFGGTVTDKGFKLLDQHVGLIYGDSITLVTGDLIMKRLMDKGFASGNWVLGIGSFTYQYITRDTHGWAMKATFGQVAGEGYEIYKDPATDAGKKSAKGLLRVEFENGNFVLYDQQTPEQEKQGVMQTLFFNDEFHNLVDLKTLRERFGLIKLNV